MSIKRTAMLLLSLSFIADATAGNLSVGAGVIYNESVYRGYNENTHAVPIINYEGNSFIFARPHWATRCLKTNVTKLA